MDSLRLPFLRGILGWVRLLEERLELEGLEGYQGRETRVDQV